MPLPTSNQVWPPADFAPIAAKYAEHSAWYAGDPVQLRDTYQRPTLARVDRTAQYRGGVQGAIARFWWGRPIGDLTRRQDFLHVPLASDICQASADLLFAESPTLKSSDQTTQDRLDTLVEHGLLETAGEASEVGAALGGSFLRVTWTEDRDRGAFLTSVDADGAYPTFLWGELQAVTFWWVVSDDGNVVRRHLERHELDSQGIGVIFHGLYEGTKENLGRAIPLAEHPSTEGLVVDAESKISTLTPGLAVEYFPNQRPQRLLRKHPIGRNLGRSDLAGIEPLMDSIDETYSSWMRDIRLAKGRIIAPQYMLTSDGRGRGALLDLDQEVFVGVNQAPTEEGQAGLTINQFAIRTAEHQATVTALVKAALRTAGYSGETFGEGDDGVMKTATEVVSEQTRSYLTRDRKLRIVKPRLTRILRKLLAVDNAVYTRGVNPEDLSLEFAEGVQVDIETAARTAQYLKTAQAASTRTMVQMLHPDWDEKQIDDEVALIGQEKSITIPDFGPLPDDPDDQPVDNSGDPEPVTE